MRFSLLFQLEHIEFPIDKNPCLISFFKKAITEYNNAEYYEEYFSISAKKNYAFSVLMPDSVFYREKIVIPGKMIKVFFSSEDNNTAITFYNAFTLQKNNIFLLPQSNNMTLTKITEEQEMVIVSRQIIIKMNSPLCIRIHNRSNNQDVYLESNHPEFETALRTIVRNQVKQKEEITDQMVEEFRCIPLKTRKTVVLHHGQFITCNIGMFGLFGNQRLLSLLYMNGMGSRKNGGFGLFQVVEQGGE